MEQAIVFSLGALLTTHLAGKQINAKGFLDSQFGAKNGQRQQHLTAGRAAVDNTQVSQRIDQNTMNLVDPQKLAVLRYKSKFLKDVPGVGPRQALGDSRQAAQTLGKTLSKK
jgi:hypothetical protein